MLRLPTLYPAFGSVVVLGFSCGRQNHTQHARKFFVQKFAKNYSDHVVKPTHA